MRHGCKLPSDLIDGKAAADKAGVRAQAVANAVAFTFELLHRFAPSPPLPDGACASLETA
jgi:hypothetical protein